MKTRNRFLLLPVIYLCFFALGLPEGAFGVTWPFIRADVGFDLEMAGIILVFNAIAYTFASAILGRFSNFIKLESINLLGITILTLSLLGIAVSPNFASLVIVATVLGIGSGFVDSSLNLYMTKSFSSRYMNWLHCFWSFGAAASPIFITQVILNSGWRLGYASMGFFLGFVAIAVLISRFKGLWQISEKAQSETSEEKPERKIKVFLTKKRHQFMKVCACFLYGGAEYSMGFWITSVLLYSRGLSIEIIGIFHAVFYGTIMGGRLFFGWLANTLANTVMIRIGFLIALAGLIMLTFSNNILGIALVGFGFAPIFPCLIHETSNRFSPKLVTRLVGFEVAAFSAGVAILSSIKGPILERVSLEALFPMTIGLIVISFLINETIERAIGLARQPA